MNTINVSGQSLRRCSLRDQAELSAQPRKHLGIAVSCLLTLSLAGVASAQDVQERPRASAGELEEIVVTGTLLRATGMTTPTPVTVMQAEELSAMSPGQLIYSLDQLPQFIGNARPDTTASKADSAGASNLNMRGIGSKRTLILLDGRRVVPSNRLGIVDINLFPEALLQRVETVTGGASAAYGTDAVAGVVNFIVDSGFTGFRGHAQTGRTERGDNDTYEVSFAGGTPIGERLHLIGAYSRYHADRVDNPGKRDWYRGIGTVTNPVWLATGLGPRLVVQEGVVSTQYTDGGFINAPGTSIHRLHFLPDGSTAPFEFGDYVTVGTGTNNMVGGSGYNPSDFDPTIRSANYPHGSRSGSFVPDSKQNNVFLRLTYDLSDSLKLYTDAMWGGSETNAVGTLPLGHSIWAMRVFAGNPFLPENIAQAMADENIASFPLERYHTEADIAQDRFIMHNDTYSYTVGFDKELRGGGAFDGWLVQGYWQSGTNFNEIDHFGFIRRDRLPMAMDAVRHPDTNEIVCNVTLFQSGFDDCVPINLLGAGRASPEAVAWVTDQMWQKARMVQHNTQITASSEVSDGWGAGPISLAVGAAWREQSIRHRLSPDHLVNQPPLANDPANGIRGISIASQGTDDRLEFVDLDNFDGSFSVSEVFAETLVPLVSGRPVVDQLNASFAARYADYEGSGGIWAWKYGLDWRVNDALRVRGTVSRDVRAASLEERFDRQGQGTSLTDPQFNNQTFTTFQLRGGNPTVSPEKADTATLGLVYQPVRAPNLSMSLDWYDVQVNGAIDFLGVQAIVNQCEQTGIAEFCNRITRNPETNVITLVENTFANTNTRKVAGIDYEMTWRGSVDWFGGGAETIRLRLLASRLDEISTITAGAPKRDLAGQLGGTGFPDLQIVTNAGYANGPFSLFLQSRYIASGIQNIDWVEGVDIASNQVPARHYADMRASWNGDRGRGDWEVFLHVANLFDKDPPIMPGWSAFGGTGIGTNRQLYDIFGRRYTAGFRIRM